MIAALCLIVTVAYGALFYGFAVLITEPAAGGEFSRALLSSAYGGAVLTGGLAAIPGGRAAAGGGGAVRLVREGEVVKAQAASAGCTSRPRTCSSAPAVRLK